MVSCENITDILSSKLDIETGLYNSAGFCEKIDEWIKENPGRRYSLYRYRLDGFDDINGIYGFKAGKKLLRDIGRAVHMRDTGESFSAHLNAEHFARFCAGDYLSAEECYECFLNGFADYEIHYPFSVHVGVYNLCEADCNSYMMSYKAHLALQSIENDQSTHIAYYKKGLMDATKNEKELIRDVEGAVREEQFELWLQPQFDYSGEIFGAECLVRWRHPQKGLIKPAEFISLLEKSKQITLVDRFVWDKCCELAGSIAKTGISIPLSVNVSRIDIQSCDVCRCLTEMVKKYDIQPECIHVEITESTYLTESENLRETVTALKKKGFVVEMDDFGSGYSSLNILMDLDIDVLKLDKKLVSGIDAGNEKSRNIVRAVMKMAQSLEISVIAEGVENKKQADFLNSIGCNVMQGYYYAKPMPAKEFKSLLKEKSAGEV